MIILQAYIENDCKIILRTKYLYIHRHAHSRTKEIAHIFLIIRVKRLLTLGWHMSYIFLVHARRRSECLVFFSVRNLLVVNCHHSLGKEYQWEPAHVFNAVQWQIIPSSNCSNLPNRPHPPLPLVVSHRSYTSFHTCSKLPPVSTSFTNLPCGMSPSGV